MPVLPEWKLPPALVERVACWWEDVGAGQQQADLTLKDGQACSVLWGSEGARSPARARAQSGSRYRRTSASFSMNFSHLPETSAGHPF